MDTNPQAAKVRGLEKQDSHPFGWYHDSGHRKDCKIKGVCRGQLVVLWSALLILFRWVRREMLMGALLLGIVSFLFSANSGSVRQSVIHGAMLAQQHALVTLNPPPDIAPCHKSNQNASRSPPNGTA